MATMDNQTSSQNTSKESLKTAKLVGDKASVAASKLISRHNNSILRSNEIAANSHFNVDDNNSAISRTDDVETATSQLHGKDNSSSILKADSKEKLHSEESEKFNNILKNYESSTLKMDDSFSVLKADSKEKLHSGKSEKFNNILRNYESSTLKVDDTFSVLRTDSKEKLHSGESEKLNNILRNYESSALKVDDKKSKFQITDTTSQLHTADGSSVLKTNAKAKLYNKEPKKNSNKLKDRPIQEINGKLNKTISRRYYKDYHIEGGIKTPLRVNMSLKSKLRTGSIEKNAGKLGNIGKNAIAQTADTLDTDDLGLQKAWVDATSKTIDNASTVYKVSKTAKYWRKMKNERKIASLLKKEERIMKNSFRAEYREAFNLFKSSEVSKTANFFEKQKYKKFLKKKYMKNAMKQYREAKKVGNASKTVFSTGLSFKDTLSKVGNSAVETFKVLVSKKVTWIILLCLASVMLLPIVFSVFVNLFMSLFGSGSNSESAQPNKSMPNNVVQWQEFVEERCAANNDPDSDTDLTKFVNAILATIWQESGGNPDSCSGDIMQCKACGLWDDSKMPSDWSEAQKSIDVGIRYFYSGLKNWRVTDAEDYDGLQIVAQGYNYGFAFLGWMKGKNASKWTKELSTEYSTAQAVANGWKSYGHITYGQEWLDKYKGSTSSPGSGEVDQQKGLDGVINTALNQEGITENPAGSNTVVFNTDYYGKEVSGDDYPWCCTFVWWCFEKSGNGNLIPKTASSSYMAAHIGDNGGKRLSNVYEAKKGDLVIFRGGEHIGIVLENKGGGNLITIEGNTTPENGSGGSDYNGGCVAKRNRNISTDSITAVVRPKYPD